MRKIYWRPQQIAPTVLYVLILISLVTFAAVEVYKAEDTPTYSNRMYAASRLARECFEAVKQERERLGQALNERLDPADSGLIGLESSAVTSVSGSLVAKQTSVNPNWAAVIVDMLHEAGVAKGDVVAVGASGSFPALNICVYAALEELKVKPIVISSAAASQYGANIPRLLWIDMERLLDEKGLITTRSVAASLGGAGDVGAGLSDRGKRMLEEAIQRNELDQLKEESFIENVQDRMSIYRGKAGDKQIKLYINIGGGTASVGTIHAKKEFSPGLIFDAPPTALAIESVMGNFIKQDRPVIHMSSIATLAERYGLPVSPTSLPQIGDGGVYARRRYQRWLAAMGLVVVIGGLFLFMRSGRAAVAFNLGKESSTQFKPMV